MNFDDPEWPPSSSLYFTLLEIDPELEIEIEFVPDDEDSVSSESDSVPSSSDSDSTMTTPPPADEFLVLNGVKSPFKSTPRAAGPPVVTSLILCSQASRDAMTPKESLKLRETFEVGITPKLNYEPLIKMKNDPSKYMAHTEKFIHFGNTVSGHLTRYDMEDFKKIYKVGPDGEFLDQAPIDLITSFTQVTRNDVLIHQRNLTTCSGYNALNALDMHSMRKYLENSVTSALLIQVNAALETIPDVDQRTGPVFMYELLIIVSRCNESTLRDLRKHLYEYKVLTAPHASITVYNQRWIVLLQFLKTMGISTDDALTYLHDHYQTTPSEKLNSFIKTHIDMRSPATLSIAPMMDLVKGEYERLDSKGEYHGTTTGTQSAFNAKGKRNKKDKVAEDAVSDDKQPAQPAANAGKSTKPKHLPEKDRRGNPIDRNPPKEGQPHTREGDQPNWCSKCDWGTGRWGTHLTEGHDAFVKELQDRKKNRGKTKDKETPPASTSALRIPRAGANFASVTHF